MKPEDKVKVQQALEAMDSAWGYGSQRIDDKLTAAITALRQLLEQPESVHETGSWYAAREIDEMVRDLDVAMNGDGAAPQASLCDLMPQLIERLTGRPAAWVDLSVEQKMRIHYECEGSISYAIELTLAKLREKNGGA
jgi:hypothetical protein